MRTDDVLTLTQWLSPAFPVGAFAYSHGLEAAFEAGWVTDAESLKAWITDLLTLGSANTDAHFMAAAALHTRKLSEVDGIARAFAPCRERLSEACAQGKAFCDTVSAVWSKELDGLTYPVALGHAVHEEGLPLDLAITLYLQAFVTNLVANAQRLGPIGQTEAQQVIRDLAPLIEETAREAADGELTHIASNAFLSDIAAMKHETQYSRMFRS
ncbi:urease accessory protein UreF [Maritimibacter dapengensis]|uniref:Urease accessory protein UreF n=1 Tax=Maritimibacter dapengensis TaxID=2836868 RepID=A0ABS6SX80_9RHOB|nr:urease accessory UreF family protein [Maritimibacter dapengensis]MBV7377547.1 urease accessory protein UreF [Maritimibacter dapengensis]